MRQTIVMAALLLVIWAIVLPARAQTYEYSFTSNMGTYTPIDGGILLGTETSDDQRFVDPATPAGGTVTTGPGFDIGFNFTFNGASFDRLAINNNGWISLGQSALTPSVNNASTSGYTPISSVVAIDPAVLYNRIAGFARDIQAQAGASLRLQTIGTAPNRICVVQWANYKKYGTSGTGDVLNFQIRLYETTNNVQIVYGAMTCNTTAGNMQVGLRGPLATDFFSRTSATGWDNTTASTAYDQYVVLTDQYFPANGLTYSFNFPVATQPPNPAVLISPSDLATLVSPTATLNWISGGGLPTGFRLSFGTNNPPTNIVNNVDMGSVTSYNPNPDMQLSTTYYWKVVPYNNIGSAMNCPVWSFTTHGDPTVSTLPYSQNWDNVTVPALPFDWTAISQGTVTTSYVKTVTTSPHTTPNCVALYNSSDATGNYILVGPQVMPPLNVNSIRVKFWGKGGAAYHLLVGVMTNPSDPATFTTVQDVNVIANWNEYAVGLTGYAGTGRYIAFKHANASSSQTLYVDEVSFEQIAANDLACTGLSGNTTPSVNSPITYTATVFNWGTASQSTYTVKLYNSTGTELASVAGTTVAPGATATVSINWTPTAEGPATLYARVILTGDVNPANDQSPNLAITVMPSGTYVVTVGDGTANIRMPLDFFYKNSINETLYFPTELGMYGNVSSITLYNNFPAALDNMPVKIWMGSTTLSDLSAGWIPSGELTSVFDGTVSFPMGENSITIPLQTAYSYSSGNLVVMFHRPMDTQYYSSSDYFKGQTVGTNRARNVYNDTTVYDPAAPGTVGTVTGQFAKTTFHMTPLSPNPLFSVSPASKDFGTVLLNTTNNQVFTVMNVGGGTLSVSNISIAGSPFYTLQNMPTLPASLGTGQSITFTARYLPTAAGTHIATISITDNRMVHTVALSGTCMDPTITTLPYSQAFDGVTPPALPVDWSYIYQATVTTGYVKTVTTSPQSTPNCVAMYNPTDVNTIAMLIAPPLANTINASTVRVKFWGKGSTTYSVKVGVMTNPSDPATFTEIQQITLTASWAQYVIPLTTYTGAGHYIAFKHASSASGQTIYLDTVDFELIAPNDLAAISVTGNSTPSVGASTPYTVTVFNNGTDSQATYTVKLYNGQNVELASAVGTTIAAGESLPVVMNWTPTVEGPQTLYGKVILAGDVNAGNDQTPNLAITVMPEGIITVTIGDGSQNARMPIDMFYKNSVYQTLYYPNEIGVFGNITALSIYNNFVTTTLQNKPTKIWIGSTTLEDLSAGWIPSTSLTLVFDGNMTYPAGQNTIVFPLTTPFTYAGGNLVIMWNRPMDTQYFSSSDYFLCQTVGTNRARNIFSDSTTYDPATVTAGTLTGQFPKTTLTLTPMTADPIFNISPASYNFGDVNLGGTATTNFTMRNLGGGTLVINSVTMAGSPTFALTNMPTFPVSLTTGQTSTFTVSFTPNSLNTFNTVISITDNIAGRRDIGLGSLNDSNRTVHTVNISGTGVNDITIGAGTTNARMPLDFYYKNSIYEMILTNAELNNFVGIITGIKLYSQFTSNLTAMPTKVWIGTTTQTDLAADWIPSTQLTSVFDGTLNYPSGENVISITFSQPYMYLNSENLVLMFNRPIDTVYYSSSDYFKCQTIGTNRARNIYSDSATYDPAAPTGGTVTGQFPKITFVIIPGGVGHIQGTVLGAGNQPLEGVAVQIVDSNYSATTNAAGQYTIPNVLPNTYTIQFSKYGYVTQSQNFVLVEDETETININLVPMATVNVTGTVLASDTAAGLSGALIHLEGYANYNGNSTATGAFTIPSVYANQTYNYTIICAGYTTRTGTVNVGATNHNMGNMILNEVAYSPLGVTAAANDLNTQVALTWLAPDPNALEITESFEAETFPPTEWARTITNTGPANTLGIFPSWCRFGAVTISGQAANPTNGSYQAGLYWDYAHQDEWLITPGFNCPPSAYLRFDGYVFLGSENADHYYVKASIDNGVNWTVLWDASAMTGGWNYYASPITVDLSTYGGQQLKLAFHATDGPNDDGLWYVWFIDNIYIGNAITNIRFTTEELTSRSANPNGASFSGSVPTRAASRRMEEGGNRTEPRLPFLNEVRHNADVPRVLTGYKVWRLAAGQETNEPSWTSLTPQAITALNLTDTGWQTLPNGDYRWAVKAIYTADVSSAAALSNILTKQAVTGMIAGVVRRQNTTPISGATITAGGFTATTNTAGAYSMVVPVGTYSVTASATGFVSNTVENVTVVQNLTTTVNFVLTPGSPNDDPNAPVNATVLRGNYPNPFNPETTIAYSVKEPGPVWIGIYNVKGQLIRTLVNDVRATGHYTVVFDGRDDNGRSVSSGIYFLKMNAGDYRSTRKMIMMQ